jgi:hypothetical protein
MPEDDEIYFSCTGDLYVPFFYLLLTFQSDLFVWELRYSSSHGFRRVRYR